jgi:hypothetical protein
MEEFEVGQRFVQRLSGTIATYDRRIGTALDVYGNCHRLYVITYGNGHEACLTDKEIRENFVPVKG